MYILIKNPGIEDDVCSAYIFADEAQALNAKDGVKRLRLVLN